MKPCLLGCNCIDRLVNLEPDVTIGQPQLMDFVINDQELAAMNDNINLSSNAHEIDVSVLMDLVDNNPETFRKFALLFISSFETVLANIDVALETSDMTALCAMGHRGKSTARNVGAISLGRGCETLERLSQEAGIEEASRAAKSLRPMFEAVREVLLSARVYPPGHSL